MLILLDIDGVMVPANSWKKLEFLDDGFPEFGKNAVKALQKIITETSADILLTTTHKAKYTIEQWQRIFELRGININNITCLPENLTNLSRKAEILEWIAIQKELPDFIIIDDDKSLNSLPEPLKEKLIQTSGSVGLTEDLVNDYLEILT